MCFQRQTQQNTHSLGSFITAFFRSLFFVDTWFSSHGGMQGFFGVHEKVGPLSSEKMGVGSCMNWGIVGLQRSRIAAKVALTVALSLKNVGQNNSFSSSSIMVNLMAPPASVGAINGASQTLASFVRAV
jgi:hypothetical protein